MCVGSWPSRNGSGANCRGEGMKTRTSPTAISKAAAVTDDDQCEHLLLPESEVIPDEFPRLRNMSSAFMFSAIFRPVAPEPPSYAVLPDLVGRHSLEGDPAKTLVAVAKWNLLWEAGQFRRRFFDLDELPPAMAKIADLDDINVVFVPRTRSRYHEYAPLLHLLPSRVLRRFGLPLLRGGLWPYMADHGVDDVLPVDFEHRLQHAWAWMVWPHLVSGSPMRAFSGDEPLRMLAHNLDFWAPAVTEMMQTRLSELPEVNDEGDHVPEVVTLVEAVSWTG